MNTRQFYHLKLLLCRQLNLIRNVSSTLKSCDKTYLIKSIEKIWVRIAKKEVLFNKKISHSKTIKKKEGKIATPLFTLNKI